MGETEMDTHRHAAPNGALLGLVLKAPWSCQRRLNELPAVLGESIVPPVEVECQPHVIEAHESQDGRVQITHVIGGFDGAVAERIGSANQRAGFDPRAREPHRLRPGIVVAPGAALRDGHPAEFAQAHDECLIEQPGSLEILQQSGDWTVNPLRAFPVAVLETAVRVPCAAALR